VNIDVKQVQKLLRKVGRLLPFHLRLLVWYSDERHAARVFTPGRAHESFNITRPRKRFGAHGSLGMTWLSEVLAGVRPKGSTGTPPRTDHAAA
jgi:hypothetical protein